MEYLGLATRVETGGAAPFVPHKAMLRLSIEEDMLATGGMLHGTYPCSSFAPYLAYSTFHNTCSLLGRSTGRRRSGLAHCNVYTIESRSKMSYAVCMRVNVACAWSAWSRCIGQHANCIAQRCMPSVRACGWKRCMTGIGAVGQCCMTSIGACVA